MTCAHAVRVAIGKLPEVEKVDVGLKRGVATIDLRPRNGLRLSTLLQIIRDNGFVTRGVEFNARAAIVGQAIEIAGTREQVRLAPGQSPVASGVVHAKITIPRGTESLPPAELLPPTASLRK